MTVALIREESLSESDTCFTLLWKRGNDSLKGALIQRRVYLRSAHDLNFFGKKGTMI